MNPNCIFLQNTVCSCISSQVSSLFLLYFLHLYPSLSHWQCRVEELEAMCAGLGQLQGFSSVLGCFMAAGAEHTDQPRVHTGQPWTPHISTQWAYLGEAVCTAALAEPTYKGKESALWASTKQNINILQQGQNIWEYSQWQRLLKLVYSRTSVWLVHVTQNTQKLLN